MAGSREKEAPRPRATPTPITAGGCRPTRAHRPIERFAPELPPPSASSRSRKTPPNRVVPSSGPPILIRLKVPSPANPATLTNQTQPSDLTVSVNANSITDLRSSVIAANSTTDVQATIPTTGIQSSSKAASGPLTKFDVFPKLPAELRHMVWKCHLPGPRIVTIQFEQDGRKHIYQFSATNALPFLLRVCHEAREVFLLRYKRYAFNHPRCTNGCYFNFEQDILAFQVLSAHGQRTRWLSHPTVGADTRNVKNLAFSNIEMWKELNGEEKRYRPLPLPTFLNFDQVQKVLVVYLIRHPLPCSFCRAGEIPSNDQEMLDDLKTRVSKLKDVLEEGKMYSFMFGKEWEPPEWEWLPSCINMEWRRTYLKSLEKAARVEDITGKPAGEVTEGVAQLDEVADEAAGEQIEDTDELKGESMETTAQLEEVTHKSPEDTIDDDMIGGSESSVSETLSMMDIEGESVSSTSSSEDASIMGMEMEDLLDED